MTNESEFDRFFDVLVETVQAKIDAGLLLREADLDDEVDEEQLVPLTAEDIDWKQVRDAIEGYVGLVPDTLAEDFKHLGPAARDVLYAAFQSNNLEELSGELDYYGDEGLVDLLMDPYGKADQICSNASVQPIRDWDPSTNNWGSFSAKDAAGAAAEQAQKVVEATIAEVVDAIPRRLEELVAPTAEGLDVDFDDDLLDLSRITVENFLMESRGAVEEALNDAYQSRRRPDDTTLEPLDVDEAMSFIVSELEWFVSSEISAAVEAREAVESEDD